MALGLCTRVAMLSLRALCAVVCGAPPAPHVRNIVPPPRMASPSSSTASSPTGKRKRAATRDSSDARLPLYKRLPWTAIVITLLLLASALASTPAVRDATTGERFNDASLTFSTGYLALSPLWDVFDAWSLLSVRDHVAVFLWLAAIYVVWRVLRRRGATMVGRKRREAGMATLFLVGLLLLYSLAALLPRPMAQLVTSGATSDALLVLDVHSHTRYSHDGRPGWSPEDVRAWHRDAGYNVAFISDHRTFDGIERGLPNNPPQAGQGTTLLPAIEVVWQGVHVNVLNAGARYRGITTESLRDIDEQALTLASMIANTEPVLVQTIPDDLSKMHPAHGPGTPGVRAIELIDGSPRGLGQGRQQRARIVKLADSLNLALVAGSNNHGWGRTASGWTLMVLPGWRGMQTDSLSSMIDRVFRLAGRQATLPIERVGGTGDGALAVMFALPVVVWRMFATLSGDQRAMWLLWTWAIVLIARGVRMWRHRPRTSAA